MDMDMDLKYNPIYEEAAKQAASPPPAPAPQEKKLNIPNLLIGFLVLLLAAFGVYQLIHIGLTHVRTVKSENAAIANAAYLDFLIPAAAIDLAPFEDITAADMSELVEMSVWAVLNSGLDAARYQYEDAVLLLPQGQVEAYFAHFFGVERSIEHRTVSGYGYQFEYDAAAKVYRIPLSSISPLYTPVITETETKGDATVLTVGLRNAALYSQNLRTGDLTVPEPDKYIRVTFRSTSAGVYISAVRSAGLPEIASAAQGSVVSSVAPPPQTTAAPPTQPASETAASEEGESSAETETTEPESEEAED